jgi:hypothetical protein
MTIYKQKINTSSKMGPCDPLNKTIPIVPPIKKLSRLPFGTTESPFPTQTLITVRSKYSAEV